MSHKPQAICNQAIHRYSIFGPNSVLSSSACLSEFNARDILSPPEDPIQIILRVPWQVGTPRILILVRVVSHVQPGCDPALYQIVPNTYIAQTATYTEHVRALCVR